MWKVFFCETSPLKIFSKYWWCNKCNNVGKRVECARTTENYWENTPWVDEPQAPCETCGEACEFSGRSTHRSYRRIDTGEVLEDLRDHPGACYEVEDGAFDRYSKAHHFGPDGRALAVVLPNGHHWYIDSRASNCDMKEEHNHRCWVRHGRPEDGTLHVDKNGHTCNAGAGSILSGDFHGFLHEGSIVVC